MLDCAVSEVPDQRDVDALEGLAPREVAHRRVGEAGAAFKVDGLEPRAVPKVVGSGVCQVTARLEVHGLKKRAAGQVRRGSVS